MKNIITFTFSITFLIFKFTYAEEKFRLNFNEENLNCDCTSQICNNNDAMKGINHLRSTKFLSSTTILCAGSILRKGTCNCFNGNLLKDDGTRVKRDILHNLTDLKKKIDQFCRSLTNSNINDFQQICDVISGDKPAMPGSTEELIRKGLKILELVVTTFFDDWPFGPTTTPRPMPKRMM